MYIRICVISLLDSSCTSTLFLFFRVAVRASNSKSLTKFTVPKVNAAYGQTFFSYSIS